MITKEIYEPPKAEIITPEMELLEDLREEQKEQM